jgi:hypothetical protein
MATELNDTEDQKLWPPQIEKLFIDLMVDTYVPMACRRLLITLFNYFLPNHCIDSTVWIFV